MLMFRRPANHFGVRPSPVSVVFSSGPLMVLSLTETTIVYVRGCSAPVRKSDRDGTGQLVTRPHHALQQRNTSIGIALLVIGDPRP